MTAAGITLGDAMSRKPSGSFSEGGWDAWPDRQQPECPEVLAVLTAAEGAQS